MDKDTLIKPAIRIKLASIDDLVRMAFFNAARNTGMNFLYFPDPSTKKWIIGFLTGVGGYYDFRGIPMFFYVPLLEKLDTKRFIQYTAKEKEKWAYTDSIADVTKWNYLPIIEIDGLPMFY